MATFLCLAMKYRFVSHATNALVERSKGKWAAQPSRPMKSPSPSWKFLHMPSTISTIVNPQGSCFCCPWMLTKQNTFPASLNGRSASQSADPVRSHHRIKKATFGFVATSAQVLCFKSCNYVRLLASHLSLLMVFDVVDHDGCPNLMNTYSFVLHDGPSHCGVRLWK